MYNGKSVTNYFSPQGKEVILWQVVQIIKTNGKRKTVNE